MTDEQRDLLERVLAHQLQGIMFHFDLMCMLQLFNDRPMLIASQYKQVVAETKCHMDTMLKIIDTHSEIINPSEVEKIPLTVVLDDRPASKLQRDIFTKKLLTQWIEYENMTVDLYQEVIDAFPECDRWKKLQKGAQSESKTAEKLLSRLE